ncbi:MAG: hypothetical protein R3250_14825, partial [Melioribacteraceae bacterium]|nr:hypothetical protein [Melioribacteraceae bacterium]
MKESIHGLLEDVRSELLLLKRALNGEISDELEISFPALDKRRSDMDIGGMIEGIQIILNPMASVETEEFNIIPSLPNIDPQLREQIKISWKYSKDYFLNKQKRSVPPMEVTIKFINKFALYEGNSLGVVLTISMIHELYRYYDLRDQISFEKNIIATGPIADDGSVSTIGDQIIQSKASAAFYSTGECFLVPLPDTDSAEERIRSLKEKWSERKITVVPIKNIEDVLNRRDLITISKQNAFKWGGKRLARNKIAVAVTFLLLAILTLFILSKVDDNPQHIDITDRSFQIMNQYDENLWEVKVGSDINSLHNISEELWKKAYKIIDINKNIFERLKYPDRVLTVSIPVKMDSG